MLGDSSQDLFPENRDQVGLADDGAFMREQNLKPLMGNGS